MGKDVCENINTKICADGTCPKIWDCPYSNTMAEILIEKGYRKIIDGVVLSKEEYEEYKQFQTFLDEYEFENVQDMEDTLNICQKLLYERLKQAHKKGSKETAENILNTEFFVFETKNRGEEYQKGYMQAVRECRSRKDELAKQFCVEIKGDIDK